MSGITINPANGRVFFPLLEPFGKDLEKILRDSLSGDAAELAVRKYVYQALYDSTKTKAQQIAEKNKFLIAGQYSSSNSSEIMLNAMNVPQGSVKVTAGGRELIEGTGLYGRLYAGQGDHYQPGNHGIGNPHTDRP